MLEEKIRRARILIVDDEVDNVHLLRRILEPAGYVNIRETHDPSSVRDLLREFDPDLIMLDLLMPGMDGHEVLAVVREGTAPDEYLPVLVLTSDSTRDAKRRALSGGARDYLTKPLSPSEVRSRVRNLLETRVLYRELQDQNIHLEERVRDRTLELEAASLHTLQRLARAAEYRDDATGQHTRRVGHAAAQIASELGLEAREVEMLRLAAPLHDVGKIGIPDAILLSDGSLTQAEFEIMKTHCVIGADLLSGSDVPLLRMASEIALTHHERWDGLGYPYGLSGIQIPLSGRIVAVADTFDALTHPRPYKPAWSAEEAFAEVARGAGERFEPTVVEAFEATLVSLVESCTGAPGTFHAPGLPRQASDGILESGTPGADEPIRQHAPGDRSPGPGARMPHSHLQASHERMPHSHVEASHDLIGRAGARSR